MKDSIEIMMGALLLLVSVFLIAYAGYIFSERNHCRNSGGHYSFDFGECVK
jgi:high-affinity Fe2+/Pb2+ permease